MYNIYMKYDNNTKNIKIIYKNNLVFIDKKKLKKF